MKNLPFLDPRYRILNPDSEEWAVSRSDDDRDEPPGPSTIKNPEGPNMLLSNMSSKIKLFC